MKKSVSDSQKQLDGKNKQISDLQKQLDDINKGNDKDNLQSLVSKCMNIQDDDLPF